MTATIFQNGGRTSLQTRLMVFLNQNQELMSPRTLNSPRAAGDAIQELIADNFASLAKDLCSEYSSDFARRSMADLAFTDIFGNYHVVDVKTHREDTKFNMPNLTSVERLSRLYEDDKNYFSVLMVKYKVEAKSLIVTEVIFMPIEFFDWDCLTVGALGWGQIQIANSNKISARPNYSRKQWMIELCDIMLEFYPKEIQKIGERISRFETIKAFWQNKLEN